ncbi:hypothetical protein K501DRAFT_331646 [Backusella circina FSU 941]|nr:hypothetical protein K501DRAFT_331646 [Backusella circina FSU 941]
MSNMTVQLLVPSRGHERIQFIIDKEETVSSFRKRVASEINLPTKNFYLIALGKILVDRCNDKTPSQLFNTYSVRHQTCIFAHVRPQLPEDIEAKEEENRKKAVAAPKNLARINHNSIIEPFGGDVCELCHNDNTKTCKECGCQACHKKTGNPLICDQCDCYWHCACAGLDRLPTEEFWYCPNCENRDTSLIVGKGKSLATNSKRKYLTYTTIENESIVVPITHVGNIPGVYCGQSWKGRRECSAWGVHRPSVSTIGGSNKFGAVSLILSLKSTHGYDKGYEFIFAGSGGCKVGNRYTSDQTGDQKLQRFNLSLALSCDAPVDEKKGAVAFDWKKSRPLRVCRADAGNAKYRTEFTPEKGIRYDGLYKLVKYWPDRHNKLGFIVWKFLLRRDDNECPPWMSHGKRLMARRGIRTVSCLPSQKDEKPNSGNKLVAFKVPQSVQKLIEMDELDKRLWDDVLQQVFYSKYEFLHYLFDKTFVCTSGVCSKPIKDPVTAPCGHICCLSCITQSGTSHCFVCRTAVPDIQVNTSLVNVLKALYKGYGKDVVNQIPALNPSVKRKKNDALPAAINNHVFKKKKVYVVIENNCGV